MALWLLKHWFIYFCSTCADCVKQRLHADASCTLSHQSEGCSSVLRRYFIYLCCSKSKMRLRSDFWNGLNLFCCGPIKRSLPTNKSRWVNLLSRYRTSKCHKRDEIDPSFWFCEITGRRQRKCGLYLWLFRFWGKIGEYYYMECIWL